MNAPWNPTFSRNSDIEAQVQQESDLTETDTNGHYILMAVSPNAQI